MKETVCLLALAVGASCPRATANPRVEDGQGACRLRYSRTVRGAPFESSAERNRHAPFDNNMPTAPATPGLFFSVVSKPEPAQEDLALEVVSAYQADSERTGPPAGFGPVPGEDQILKGTQNPATSKRGASPPRKTSAPGPYRALKRISIPGDTGWDYVTADTEGRRLYVPHGIEVVVLDLDSGRIAGRVTGLKGAHGVAVAREYGRGFVSSTDPGSVTIFDLKTLTVIGKLRVGDDPNGIIYDPKTRRVFSADRGSKRLTAIDAKTGEIVGTVENLGGKTEHLAADGIGHVFLNMQDVAKLHKLDVQAFKVAETWTLAPTCVQPSSMDIDTAHNRVFIGCRGGQTQPSAPSLLAVVDDTNGHIVATEPIGPGVDALEFDAAKGLIYLSTGAAGGALSIFHEDSPNTYSLLQNIETLPGARTMALDRKTGTVYLPVADVAPASPPTAENPQPRPKMVPGSFSVLVVGK